MDSFTHSCALKGYLSSGWSPLPYALQILEHKKGTLGWYSSHSSAAVFSSAFYRFNVEPEHYPNAFFVCFNKHLMVLLGKLMELPWGLVEHPSVCRINLP